MYLQQRNQGIDCCTRRPGVFQPKTQPQESVKGLESNSPFLLSQTKKILTKQENYIDIIHKIEERFSWETRAEC